MLKYHYISHTQQSLLRMGYYAKAVFTFVLIVLAIAFGVLLVTRRQQNAAAILEWTISFGYTFYLLTFWWDMRQSKGIESGEWKADANGDGYGHGTTGYAV